MSPMLYATLSLIGKYSMEDLKNFQQQWIKNRSYSYCVLGDEKEVDFDNLAQYGPVTKLELETLFGY